MKLVDLHGRVHSYLRISVTERCNLRCTYCMPAEGVSLSPASSLLTTPEIGRLAKVFVQQGISKIRLTGGEPTVRRDIVDIVASLNDLRAIGLKTIGISLHYATYLYVMLLISTLSYLSLRLVTYLYVCLSISTFCFSSLYHKKNLITGITTNGIALKHKLGPLRKAGLNHINISLDTLDPLKYSLITRRKGLSTVLDVISLAVAEGYEQIKVNVVVIKKVNDNEICDFIEITRDLDIHVRFIEYMPFNGNQWKDEKFVPYHDMLKLIRIVYPSYVKSIDDKNDTSKVQPTLIKYFKVPGFKGRFGFITSMSDHFCGTCNRLRVLADGNMKVCLFGNTEVNLRDEMRRSENNDKLIEIIGEAVKRKHKQHAGMENLAKMPNRPMILIGG